MRGSEHVPLANRAKRAMKRILRHRFALALLGGCVVIALGVWLSSGTMAPYASTLERPRIDKPCNYLVNTDHVHFEATFFMLDGRPREQWDFSIYLRRILFPLLAYPLMKLLGFMAGGVITSAILQIAVFVSFVIYVKRKIGEVAAYAAIALLAFYPGIYYWAGLPYHHVTIVPASLMGILLLREIEKSEPARRVAVLALLLGVLFLAYDLMPLFAPPAVLILLLRRKFRHAGVAVNMLVLPMLLTAALIAWKYDVPFRNKNTQAYYDILQAYMHPRDPAEWAALASHAPLDLLRTFFFSNFWFLPTLFLLILILNRFTIRLCMTAAEKWLLLTTLLLFAFINLAPPTPGWPFRGSGVSRIYQPAFAAMVLFIAWWMQAAWEARSGSFRLAAGALAVVTIANAAVVFGPVLHLRLADRVYFDFYRQAESLALTKNLNTFGRRPLGFCDTSITIENPPTKRELKLLKEQRQRRRRRPPATSPATLPSVPASVSAPFRGG